MAEKKKSFEVCLTPGIIDSYNFENTNVVIVDILRASSAICTAFDFGVEAIIPVETIEEAREFKKRGFLVAAERDGVILDFADFGNSPYNFMSVGIKGKTIAYSTTNGTQAIHRVASAHKIIVSSYLNLSAVSTFLQDDDCDVVILCAGWKNRFSLEDAVFAGALSAYLIESGNFNTICDSAIACMDLWSIAEVGLLKYIDKAAHFSRLRNLGLDDVIEYCHTIDVTQVIPVYSGDRIIPMS